MFFVPGVFAATGFAALGPKVLAGIVSTLDLRLQKAANPSAALGKGRLAHNGVQAKNR